MIQDHYKISGGEQRGVIGDHDAGAPRPQRPLQRPQQPRPRGPVHRREHVVQQQYIRILHPRALGRPSMVMVLVLNAWSEHPQQRSRMWNLASVGQAVGQSGALSPSVPLDRL